MLKCFKYILVLSLLLTNNLLSKELKITSDFLEVDRNNKVSIFSGNVYAFNSEIKIWSEKLKIIFDNNENEIHRLDAENKVKIINQGITATGETGIYYPDSNTLDLFGNVEVVENNNVVKCDKLILDMKNSISIMESNSSKRVEALIITN